ncbi:MAG: RnfABCDGE type electron transport complex subunit D [Fidelibacterota bacterium]|nr:MAG: RnfABCDGE type electron transport complex subunit D [Candidatus Neomarinimicrobiota bacterium]
MTEKDNRKDPSCNDREEAERKEASPPDPRLLIISSSPHQFGPGSVPKIMWSVVGALVPAAGMAVFYFGLRALWMIFVCILAAVATETLINRLRGVSLSIPDGSAVITGLLLALTLPPSFTFSGGALGAVFAIAIGKQVFGGLGYNIFNPALLGRAFLQASFPVQMTTWTLPNTARFGETDAVTAATPLGQFKFELLLTDHLDLLLGNVGGSLGETSAVAIIIGGLYLLLRKYADWRIPAGFLSTVFVLGGLFWLVSPNQYPDPVFHLLSGGLMLGAFFMATDMVTSPITPRGSWIFGVGAGLILIIIRLYGGLPEGVMYAILLMNAFTPLINRYTAPRPFGEEAA